MLKKVSTPTSVLFTVNIIFKIIIVSGYALVSPEPRLVVSELAGRRT